MSKWAKFRIGILRMRRLTIVWRGKRVLAEDFLMFRIASILSCVVITFVVWPVASEVAGTFFGVELPNSMLISTTLGLTVYYWILTKFLWRPINKRGTSSERSSLLSE